MADDKPSYTTAREARNASRMVIEGVDEPKKTFASYAAQAPADYKSPDVEDRRHESKGPVRLLYKSNPSEGK